MSDPYDILVFDLDGTLYPMENGFLERSRERVIEFIYTDCGLDRSEDALALWKKHFKVHHQTYKSLKQGAGLTFEKDRMWYELRKDGPDFFKPDLEVIETVRSLPQKKVIFTNCREKEARECLELLGLSEFFDEIYGADFMGDTAKPQKEAFEKVLRALAPTPAGRTALFEDSRKNLETARALGMGTVCVHKDTATHLHEAVTSEDLKHFDAVVPKIGHELRQKMPQLWSGVAEEISEEQKSETTEAACTTEADDEDASVIREIEEKSPASTINDAEVAAELGKGKRGLVTREETTAAEDGESAEANKRVRPA